MWTKPIVKLFGIVAVTLSLMPAPALAEVIGTMTAVQTRISGSGGKNLQVGSPISLGDQLKSNKTGLGMIVFEDESSAKIGPNSTLVIDEFVYQPGRNRGAVAVNMNSGLVRFYGGQISKSGKMEITTPHIVLGIRGGIMDMLVGNGFTKSVLRAGRMFCNVNGQRRVITKPGFACISDGGSLRVERANDDDMKLLDSREQVAGTGVPGGFGPGLEANAACTAGRHDGSAVCKSTNASLPGLNNRGGPEFGLPPLGSEENDVTTIDCSYYSSPYYTGPVPTVCL